MKYASVSLRVFTLIFSLFMFISCGENKNEKKEDPQEETVKEVSSKLEYQCPMDCEKGKTYGEQGSCPVCKMDLKEAHAKHGKKCKMHEGGECSCEAEKCKCKECKKHAKGKSCEKDSDGNCTCKECKCKNCSENAQAMSCKKDKDGKCSCEEGKCECTDCAEHA